MKNDLIVDSNDLLLVTGANGFIGRRVVKSLFEKGFTNLRCFVRPSSDRTALNKIIKSFDNKARIELFHGDLLSQDDCDKATGGVQSYFNWRRGSENLSRDAS